MLEGELALSTHRVAKRWGSAWAIIVGLVAAGVLLAVGLHGSDVTLYEHYAKAAMAAPLFHSLPREYPAASLAVFLAPEVLHLSYAVGFALLAAAAGVALALSSEGLREHPGWTSRVCVYLLVGVAGVVFARYDVFPALAAVLAVEGARRGRWGRAWAWATVGGLLKLFPFLLLPGFLLVERAQTGKWPLRRLWTAGVPVGVVSVAQLVVAPGSVLSPLRYQLHRGFELSSLAGSLSILSDPLHVHWASGFGSVEIVGTGHVVIASLVAVLMGSSLLAIWALARRGRLSVEAVSLATLSAAVLGDKAFAAQYLVWLVPFWAFWPLRRGWVAVAVLTTAVYPLLYVEAHTWGPSFYLPTAAAALRNAILIVSTACWLKEQLNGRQTRGEQVMETSAEPAHPLGRAYALVN